MPLDETVETTTIEESVTETTEAAPELSLEEEIDALAKGNEEEVNTPVDEAELPKTEETEEAVEGSEQEPTEEEAFTPDYTYKAYGEIKQMPEWAKGLVNKENHEEVKSLFEKAGGFEHLKEHSKAVESDYKNLQANYTELDQVRNDVVSAIDSGNLDKAFQALSLDEKKIFDWVNKRLDYYEMPQEQRQAIDAQHAAQKQNEMYQQQLQTQQQQNYELMMRQHNFELDVALQNPQYTQIANQYDVGQGKEGAFKNLVNTVGRMEQEATGNVLSAHDAVKKAAAMLGLQESAIQQPSTQAPVQQTNNVVEMTRPEAPPVLDGASSTGVVKKNFSSLEELEKYANGL